MEKLLLAQDRHRLQLILELNNALISKRDLRKLFEALSTQLIHVTSCGRAALLLPETGSGKLRTEMLYDEDGTGSRYEGMLVPLVGSISGKVFRTGRPIIADNFERLRNDPEIYANPEGGEFYQKVASDRMTSGCFLPLASRGRVLCVLHLT